MARFLLTHRRSGKHSETELRASRKELEDIFDNRIRPLAEGIRETVGETETERRVFVFEALVADIEAVETAGLSGEVLLERFEPYRPLWTFPLEMEKIRGKRQSVAKVVPKLLDVTVQDVNGGALGRVNVTAFYETGAPGKAEYSHQELITDERGQAQFSYGSQWKVTRVAAEAWSGFWASSVVNPAAAVVIRLTALPMTGPEGWWHRACGIRVDAAFLLQQGRGVHVGVVDTGVGPHPFLDHVKLCGAFVGDLNRAKEETKDIDEHGTHVAGLIGARPTVGSGGYAGLAPGCDLSVMRVLPKSGVANPRDIAKAVELLAEEHKVDLINISLGCTTDDPSKALRDAIETARQRGALCICAAGNGGNTEIDFPAQLAASCAIGALGKNNEGVPGGLGTERHVPTDLEKISDAGLYLAQFSDFGSGQGATLAGVAPGVSIISTVPHFPGGDPTPYMEFSGTSMAAPIACGVLAGELARDPAYLALPRDQTRADRAAEILRTLCAAHPLLRDGAPMRSEFQGRGLTST